MRNQRRIVCFFSLGLTITLGLATRKLPGWFPDFVVQHAGDMLYTVAVYLTSAAVFQNWKPNRLFLISVGFSFLVEFSQLSNQYLLVQIRQNGIGKLFLGSGFLWIDLLRYLLGGCFVATIDTLVRRATTSRETLKESP